MSPPVIVACWKPVELRSKTDALTGEVVVDHSSLGVSRADEAALEWALRSAEHCGATVRLITAGGPRTEPVLRAGCAAGASELIRVDVPAGPGQWPSDWVARALAPHVADASLVWCGDMSVDRGSGAVPAYLAAELGVAQALGLVGIDFAGARPRAEGSACLEVLRRLDGGRRESLLVRSPAVLSCEGATARLRRAPLHQVIAAAEAPIARHRAEPGPVAPPKVVSVGPYRPEARVVPPPPGNTARERIGALMGMSTKQPRMDAVRLPPAKAAEAILEALRAWGELL
ncbi:MAG: mycofactocin-associated electron transfer flavoprotein beta subunit [Acidimicrobiales bacterium]